MSKYLLRIALIIGVLVGGWFGWQWWLTQQPAELPPGMVKANGRIEAVQVDVSTKLAGRISEVLVKEGDLVARGDVLARMDTSQILASLAQARAQRAEAEQGVEQFKANVARDQSDLALARKELARYEALIKRNAVSRADYDLKRSVVAKTSAALAATRATLRTQEFGVAAAVANVNQIQTQLDDTVLAAPARGRVLYRLAEPGEVLPSGGKVLTILDLSDIYMEVYVPADTAVRLAIGGEARVVFDVAPGYAAIAHVTFVSPEAQFTPKQVETASEREKLMFRVKVRLPPERVEPYIDRIKTGIRGVAYLRTDVNVPWPTYLDQRFPDRPPATAGATPDDAARHGSILSP